MGMMDGIGSTLVGLGGSVVTGLIGAESARDANTVNMNINEQQLAFNKEQAQWNRDFQERMSSTAWQRGVGDMRAAGVNPMLSFSQGPATAPSGDSASAGSLRGVEPVPAFTSSAVSSAMDAIRTLAQVKKDMSTVDQLDALAKNTDADTALKILEKENVPARTKLMAAQTLQAIQASKSSAVHARATEAAIPLTESKAALIKNQAAVESKNPRFWGWVNAIMSKLPFVNSAARFSR